jgi:SHS2 domain-containing protein
MDDAGEALEARSPDWLQALDHTADAGMVVTAPELKTLFERAAWGMFTVITDPAKVRLETAVELAVDAPDRAALLVRWLSELNYRHITRHELFARFNILELSETRLVAEVQGEPIDPARHVIHTEIKAVTFHGLKIEQQGTDWRAQVIFDL